MNFVGAGFNPALLLSGGREGRPYAASERVTS